MESFSLEPLGDRAYLAHFDSEPDAAGWAAAVRENHWPGVTDVVLAYRSVAVFADPEQVDLVDLEARLRGARPASRVARQGKRLIIPVLYDGTDLDEVGERLGLSRTRVMELHSSVDFHVFAIGFLPGYPYAGYLPPELAGLPRRDSPRLRVPAGSVAIAGRQTGIYPVESPGGWHLLGRTPVCIANPDEDYFPIRAGDVIRFAPISVSEFEVRCHERL
jgi:KipI family sensor histidine kinase inhibitor